MRTIIFTLLITIAVAARSQDEKPPTKEEMQAQLLQTVKEAKQQIDEIKLQIAEAKKNKDDPESIKEMEKQLESLQLMVTMLGNTSISGNKIPKALPPEKNTEPAYVSPFTPITLKQPVKPPTWEQSTDQLLWYRGRSVDSTTLITSSGLIVRYSLRTNILTLQPDKKDSIYYGLVNRLGRTKQLRTDYSRRMENMMNSYFMFPLIEDALKEYELFKIRFYQPAKNTHHVQRPTSYPELERLITELEHELRNLSPANAIPPPKRPNDLCICADREAIRMDYENTLKHWGSTLYEEEISIIAKLSKILSHLEFNRRAGLPVHPGAQSYAELYPYHMAKLLERMKAKLSKLADKYEQGDVLIEDAMMQAWSWLFSAIVDAPQDPIPVLTMARETAISALRRVKELVMSGIFDKYIEEQKEEKNFNAVFDYGLYASHELNKGVFEPSTNVNEDLFSKWMQGLEKFNRFKLTVGLDFDYLQVNKADNDDPLLVAYGLLKSDEIIVSLGRHDCNWVIYLKDVNHRNRNTSGKEFEIPLTVVSGNKDYLKDNYPPFPYTGPPQIKMVFPTFNISFCGGGSNVMMDVLRYDPADVERHKNDDASKKYTLDMQFFANKVLLSATQTKLNVNDLISTSVSMMNIQSSQSPTSGGDPAFDQLKMEYLMNKKKHELQYSLSQTTQTRKTVIPLSLDPTGSSRLFHPTLDLADDSDPDREKGMIIKKGIVTLKVVHAPQ